MVVSFQFAHSKLISYLLQVLKGCSSPFRGIGGGKFFCNFLTVWECQCYLIVASLLKVRWVFLHKMWSHHSHFVRRDGKAHTSVENWAEFRFLWVEGLTTCTKILKIYLIILKPLSTYPDFQSLDQDCKFRLNHSIF